MKIYMYTQFSLSFYSTGGLCLCLTLLILCVYMKWKTQKKIISYSVDDEGIRFFERIYLFLMYTHHNFVVYHIYFFVLFFLLLLSQNSNNFILLLFSKNFYKFRSYRTHSFVVDLIWFFFGGKNFCAKFWGSNLIILKVFVMSWGGFFSTSQPSKNCS